MWNSEGHNWTGGAQAGLPGQSPRHRGRRFGEVSDDLHSLLHHLAVSRVRYAGPQVGRRGQARTEEAEIALTNSFLRKFLSVWCARPSKATLGEIGRHWASCRSHRPQEKQCSSTREKVGSTEESRRPQLLTRAINSAKRSFQN